MCTWELEGGECQRCGLFFDENGDWTWGDSFNGFSEVDDMSERDLSGEDAEMDMEDADYGDYNDEMMDQWENSFMMRRFLQHQQGLSQAHWARHRPMTHSEAGSRRSYPQSIVSEMYTDEMDTVEEEDEDGIDEDSSMNDFIDDGEPENDASTSASSTPGQTPQAVNPSIRRGRARRVVESEASSTISSIVEEEDEEDEGPIRRGQRNPAHVRILNRANGSREPSGPPSSTSTDASENERNNIFDKFRYITMVY